MRVGDILEWLAAAAFTVGAYLATHHPWPAVLVGGLALAYEAQCYATATFSRPKWSPFLRLRIRVFHWRERRRVARLQKAAELRAATERASAVAAAEDREPIEPSPESVAAEGAD